jgi:hypothetical protein
MRSSTSSEMACQAVCSQSVGEIAGFYASIAVKNLYFSSLNHSEETAKTYYLTHSLDDAVEENIIVNKALQGCIKFSLLQ